MRINTNVSALNTQRILGQTGDQAQKIMGRLSSGFRINSAADDAAGLGIANKLRADIRSMQQASRNADQATSMLQIAEGATQTVASIVDRLKELATQAASDNVDDAGRGRIKSEWTQLTTEISKIASTTKFQGNTLIDGNFGNSVSNASTALASGKMVYSAAINGTAADTYTITDQTGTGNQLRVTNGAGVTQTVTLAADGKQSVTFDQFGLTLNLDASFARNSDGSGGNTKAINAMAITVSAGTTSSFLVRSSGSYGSDDQIAVNNINLTTGASGLNLSGITLTSNGTRSEWATALTTLDTAIGTVNTALGTLGAAQNRISFASQNVKSAIQNASTAESTIRDADMAEEMSNFSKTQILQQAGIAMLAQANQAPQMVLKLLG